MAKRISITPEKCIGCRLCSVACSITKSGTAGLTDSRIWVMHFGKESVYVPVTCTHCSDAWCMRACPVEAITRDPVTRLVLVNEDKCVGCRLCTQACPLGAIVYHPVTGKAIKCDTCGGEPACVEICPTGALVFEEEGTQEHDRRKERARMVATGLLG